MDSLEINEPKIDQLSTYINKNPTSLVDLICNLTWKDSEYVEDNSIFQTLISMCCMDKVNYEMFENDSSKTILSKWEELIEEMSQNIDMVRVLPPAPIV